MRGEEARLQATPSSNDDAVLVNGEGGMLPPIRKAGDIVVSECCFLALYRCIASQGWPHHRKRHSPRVVEAPLVPATESSPVTTRAGKSTMSRTSAQSLTQRNLPKEKGVVSQRGVTSRRVVVVVVVICLRKVSRGGLVVCVMHCSTDCTSPCRAEALRH